MAQGSFRFDNTPARFSFSHPIEVGGSKAFVVPHPNDATKEIVFYSLEGPESGMYVRGSATLAGGTVTITLPEHFAALANPTSITAQLTPTADCKGLFVQSKSPSQLVVMELDGGTSAATFDYMVLAKRIGTESYPTVRDKAR